MLNLCCCFNCDTRTGSSNKAIATTTWLLGTAERCLGRTLEDQTWDIRIPLCAGMFILEAEDPSVNLIVPVGTEASVSCGCRRITAGVA